MMDLEEFLPSLNTFAPNVPEPIAIRYLREVAQDYCRRTKIWRVVDHIIITGSDQPDDVTNIPDADIVYIEAAQFQPDGGDKVDLTPATVEYLDSHRPGWQFDRSVPGTLPSYVTQTGPDSVYVVPNAEGVLHVRLVLTPSTTALTVPDALRRHMPLISKGAAARVLTLPDAEYANPQLGAALYAEYENAMNRNTYQSQRTQFRARTHTVAQYM